MPTPFAELAIPPSMRLQVHAVADRREPNWYVESLNAPRTVFQPKKIRVQAVVAGAGTPAANLTAEVSLNGHGTRDKEGPYRRMAAPPSSSISPKRPTV